MFLDHSAAEVLQALDACDKATDSAGLKIQLIRDGAPDEHDLRARCLALAAALQFDVSHIRVEAGRIVDDKAGLEATARNLALVADLYAKLLKFKRMDNHA